MAQRRGLFKRPFRHRSGHGNRCTAEGGAAVPAIGPSVSGPRRQKHQAKSSSAFSSNASSSASAVPRPLPPPLPPPLRYSSGANKTPLRRRKELVSPMPLAVCLVHSRRFLLVRETVLPRGSPQLLHALAFELLTQKKGAHMLKSNGSLLELFSVHSYRQASFRPPLPPRCRVAGVLQLIHQRGRTALTHDKWQSL